MIFSCQHFINNHKENEYNLWVLIVLYWIFTLKFYKVMAVTVLMYGSENWSLNRSDKRKIEAAEMRFLRSMAGYTL